jgi:hypothetical protein
MSLTSKQNWQKLADSWVGIAPRDADFDSWMCLNLHPPLAGHLPPEWIDRLEADPRTAAFLRAYLRSSFQWESTWVDWMPGNEVAALVLEPKETLERAVLLAGAVCCRELIAVSISRAVRTELHGLLGPEILQRLAARPSLARLPLPRMAVPASWNGGPAVTLRQSGLLCLRIAVSPFPKAMEARLAAIFPDSVWAEPLNGLSAEDSTLAVDCISAARKLEQTL